MVHRMPKASRPQKEVFRRATFGQTAVRHAPLVTRRLAFGPQGASAVLTDSLVEILVAIATGSTTAQIAATRGVSASAVEKSIARICEQLDIAKDPNLNQRVQLSRMYNHLRELDGA